MRHALPLALALTIACAGTEPAAYTIDTLPNDIVRVVNHGPSSWADTLGWKVVLDHELEAGPGSPGELVMPGWSTLDDVGRVYVVERDPMGIKVFDPEGRFVRQIGRGGSGPGEFRSPQVVVHGDTVAVYDDELMRVELFTLDGALVLEWQPPCCAQSFVGLDRAGVMTLEYGFSAIPIESRYFLRFRLDGSRVDSIPHPPVPESRSWTLNGGRFSYGIPFQPRLGLTFLADGNIVMGVNDRLELHWSRDGRDTTRLATMALAAATIPDSVRQAQVDNAYVQQYFKDIAKLGDIPTSYPVWGLLEDDGDGNLWLTHRASDGSARFLVFDSAGVYRGAVPHWFADQYIQDLRADFLLTQGQSDDGGLTLRRYRIQRD